MGTLKLVGPFKKKYSGISLMSQGDFDPLDAFCSLPRQLLKFLYFSFLFCKRELLFGDSLFVTTSLRKEGSFLRHIPLIARDFFLSRNAKLVENHRIVKIGRNS